MTELIHILKLLPFAIVLISVSSLLAYCCKYLFVPKVKSYPITEAHRRFFNN